MSFKSVVEVSIECRGDGVYYHKQSRQIKINPELIEDVLKVTINPESGIYQAGRVFGIETSVDDINYQHNCTGSTVAYMVTMMSGREICLEEDPHNE